MLHLLWDRVGHQGPIKAVDGIYFIVQVDSDGGASRRASDIHEGDSINETALKTLKRAAVTLNKSKAKT
jgi:hypothetical protein